MRIFLIFFYLIVTFAMNSVGYSQENKITISLGPSLSSTNLSWSISGNIEGTSPNILSEVKYYDILVFGPSVKLVYHGVKNMKFSMGFQKGWTLAGKVSDRDFAGDDRTKLTYDETFDSDKGRVYGLTIGGSYCFLNSENFVVWGHLIFSNEVQRYYSLKDEIPNLKTTYQTNRKAVLLGLGGVYSIGEKIKIPLDIFYSLNRITSEANWNLIEAFQHPLSFQHFADGNGYSIDLGIDHQLNRIVSTYFNLEINRFNTRPGIDKVFFNTGEIEKTRLNGINYFNKHISFGVKINF